MFGHGEVNASRVYVDLLNSVKPVDTVHHSENGIDGQPCVPRRFGLRRHECQREPCLQQSDVAGHLHRPDPLCSVPVLIDQVGYDAVQVVGHGRLRNVNIVTRCQRGRNLSNRQATHRIRQYPVTSVRDYGLTLSRHIRKCGPID